LLNLLENSNVVVIFYDFLNPNSFQKVKNDILPLASNCENVYSIIIVGNKFDLLDSINQKFAADKDREELQSTQLEEKTSIKYFAISCLNYFNMSELVFEMIESLVYPTKILAPNLQDEEVIQFLNQELKQKFHSGTYQNLQDLRPK
jgi:GTPase SAR1 family protein